jgi:hypothetical protein
MAAKRNEVPEEEDIFADAPPATGLLRPNIRQFANGGTPSTRTYAAGSPQEYSGSVKGRVLIIELKKLEKGIVSSFKNTDGSPRLQDRATVDIHVLDGDPIDHAEDGEGEEKGVFEEALTPPFVIRDQYVSQTMLVQQIEDAVKKKGRPFAYGALGFLPAKGTNKRPYVLFSTTPEERAMASAYWKNRPDPFDVSD